MNSTTDALIARSYPVCLSDGRFRDGGEGVCVWRCRHRGRYLCAHERNMEISRGKGRGYVWREILIGNCLRDGVRDLIWTSGFASIGLWSRDGLSLRRALDVLQIFEARNFNSFISIFFKLVEFSNVL